jgi:hypothetical protein
VHVRLHLWIRFRAVLHAADHQVVQHLLQAGTFARSLQEEEGLGGWLCIWTGTHPRSRATLVNQYLATMEYGVHTHPGAFMFFYWKVACPGEYHVGHAITIEPLQAGR